MKREQVLNGYVGGWVGGWMDAWMDGQTDGRTDGWVKEERMRESRSGCWGDKWLDDHLLRFTPKGTATLSLNL